MELVKLLSQMMNLGMVNFRMAFHIMEKAYFIFILVNLLKASKMVMENTISQKVISILVR